MSVSSMQYQEILDLAKDSGIPGLTSQQHHHKGEPEIYYNIHILIAHLSAKGTLQTSLGFIMLYIHSTHCTCCRCLL